MEIKSIKIENYKSLVGFELQSPNSFSVFVGPNAAGKSNVFEALELFMFCNIMNPREALRHFGNTNDLISKNISENETTVFFELKLNKNIAPSLFLNFNKDDGQDYKLTGLIENSFGMYQLTNNKESDYNKQHSILVDNAHYQHFFNLSRVFVGNSKLVKRSIQDDSKLALDASNLEKVLKRLLKNENTRDEIVEWLQLLIPGFDKIEIKTEELSGSDNLLIYEKGTNKPFNKNLISDGTYNILAILTAVYQSEDPQFLCIEEPENGLNPKVIRELVNLFRQKCNEGHFIWLNTHSQTLVSELTTEEIILVDKVDGKTIVKQVKGMNLHGLKMDEALLTNALGGGIPW